MAMNPGLDKLQLYPFEKLNQIKANTRPPKDSEIIDLSIGEPQLDTPFIIQESLKRAIAGVGKYPNTRGTLKLRESISSWATKRFNLEKNQLLPDKNVLPVSGTREALFAIAQTLVAANSEKSLVGLPNPFYQIYEGAALLAGATPYYFNCPDHNNFIPLFEDTPENIWKNMSFMYVCSPGNPTGSVMTGEQYNFLLSMADKHNFFIIVDECYSELYGDEKKPPLGILEWCNLSGRSTFQRCLTMHSLSKRSNAPGLRSGFVAGDPTLIEKFFMFRTYHGSAMPLHVQEASITAWSDEKHVVANRDFYRKNFDAVLNVLRTKLDVSRPTAGFYLWIDVLSDDIKVCEQLYSQAGLIILPGQFLSRKNSGLNPGTNRIRVALVAPKEQCIEAAHRLLSIIN
jgi:N-succinyldiaminopimelate aminotransferase